MTHLVYLAGPITGCTYAECTDWRTVVRDAVPSHIQTISPMRGKQRLKEISSGSKILMSYEDNPLTSVKGINTRDYNDVKRSAAVFVNFTGAERISVGTVMEIAWAKAFSIPTICVMEKDNMHHHSMLDYACGYVVETLEEGIEILKVLLGNDNQVETITAESFVSVESARKRNELILELGKIQLKKGSVIRSHNYEEAAKLRDTEVRLLADIESLG